MTWSPRITLHFAVAIVIAVLLLLGIVYPFLPGRYDSLAVPLSAMVQTFGVVGLVLVLPGVMWLRMPARRFAIGGVSLLLGGVIAAVLSLVAAAHAGFAFGLLTAALLAAVLLRAGLQLKRLRSADPGRVDAAPVYLTSLPLVVLIAQLALAAPVTQWSRERAMAGAGELIEVIEQYRSGHGRYPPSLAAQHADFEPGVVGVERYVYSAEGDGYNLSFEQPRFVLDGFGTREWLVYNPRDEHRAYSHAAWRLLSPETTGRAGGWYASGPAGRLHWMYFLFD